MFILSKMIHTINTERWLLGGKPKLTHTGKAWAKLRLAAFPALLLLFIACAPGPGAHTAPAAAGGTIELAGWNFTRDGIVKLDGEWEFFRGQLISPGVITGDTPETKRGFITAPSTWVHHAVDGVKMGSHGYATYRLKIRMPDAPLPLALYFHEIRTAYRAYLDGRLIAENGNVGTDRKSSGPQYLPLVKEIGALSGTRELVLHVSNFHTNQGGILRSLILGESTAVNRLRNNNVSFQMFLFGSLLIMGLFLLGMFFIQKVDKSPLYLGLFCLLISMRPLVTGEYFLTYWYPDFSWAVILKLEYLTLYAGLPLFMTFMHALFPIDMSKKLLRIVQSVGALSSLVVIITPVQIYNHTIVFYEIFTLAMGMYIVAIVIIATARRREGAAIFLMGTMVLMLTVTNEILYDLLIIHTGPFFPFGVFIFILSQAFLVSLRFSKAYERNRVLALIEQELKLAEKIQRSTLPEVTPSVVGLECSTLYIPSAYVGGDFYDFYRVDDKRMGVLIADISGHGLPSAMITSMVKVIFFMLKGLARQPELLLAEMNRILLDILKNNFATVGYLYIDLDSGKASYARGGHEPLLVQRAGEEKVTEFLPSGRMLGSYGEINCRSVEFDIKSGDRLILFTDGIIELFNTRREMYGIESFKKAINEKRAMSQSSFIASMTEDLRAWASSPGEFNDDVTIVVIDMV